MNVEHDVKKLPKNISKSYFNNIFLIVYQENLPHKKNASPIKLKLGENTSMIINIETIPSLFSRIAASSRFFNGFVPKITQIVNNTSQIWIN